MLHLAGRTALAAGLLIAVAAAPAVAQTPSTSKSAAMAEKQATGTFEVKLTPVGAPTDPVGALSIAKTFHGDLEATSVGQMLAVRTAVEGSAGYVAMERVTGSLGGKRGSFALQHSGSMDRSKPSLSVTVVPDSGTESLAGLTGSMDIVVEPGRHSYTFRYTLP